MLSNGAAGDDDEIVTNAQQGFALDLYVVLKEKIEVLGDRTGQRIFNGDYRGQTSPLSTSLKTSAETAQGTMVASGSIFNAASWLKEPSSPWIAIRISAPRT